MPITPTSAKSKNYQALGIDEIANDIETVFNAVNALEGGGGSDYTTTVVNISSAQILAMGTTPIELLPAAGANMYYDIEKIVLEYTHVTTNYTSAGLIVQGTNNNIFAYVFPFTTQNTFIIIDSQYENLDVAESYPVYYNNPMNLGLQITTFNGVDPINGNGTLRVKIYHKTITFGA